MSGRSPWPCARPSLGRLGDRLNPRAQGAVPTAGSLGDVCVVVRIPSVESKRDRIEAARREDVCPQCGKPLEGTLRIGTGSLADGNFCDLGCYGDFYDDVYREMIAGFVPSQN